MKYLYRGVNGERAIWWSWQDLRRKGKRRGFCTSGRAWLYLPSNCLGVEWYFGRRSCGVTLGFADPAVGDDAVKLNIAIPFLLSLWFTISGLPIVKRLPGVAWHYGEWGTGEREIGFAIHDATFWVYPWINRSNCSPWAFHFDDFIRGRAKYSIQEYETGEVTLSLPESDYDATYRLYRAEWKRPRWPWPLVIQRGEIEVEGGVPIPGKGENSWDCEDTCTYSLTCPAQTKEELVDKFVAGIVERREKYGWEWRE